VKLKDVWKKKEVTLSFEAFPPKKDSDFASVASAVEKIAQLKPDFMSVTYGAGGGTSAYTGKIAQIVQAQGVTALAHLTCVSSDRDRIHHELDALRQAGIENILALRGDYPEGYDPSAPRDYRYARDLVEEIRAYGGFSIGGACYPEGHVECPSQREDLRHLKEKVDCGVDFLVTQMFFDNAKYFDFVARCRREGIEVPIVAGIKPFSTKAQLSLLPQVFGVNIPEELSRAVASAADNAAVRRIGIEWAIGQCRELIRQGVPALHFYTMSRPDNVEAVVKAVF